MSDDQATEGKPATPPAPATPVPASPPKPILDYAMPAARRPLTVPKNLGCLVKMLFALGVLLVMGYCALMALNPKARTWATKGGGPTPFKAINQILAIPAQAVGKTTDVVVANDARVGQLDGLIAEEEGKGRKGGSRPVVDPFSTPAPETKKKSAAGGGTKAAATSENEVQSISRDALLALAENNASTSASAPLPARPKPVLAPEPTSPEQMKLPGDILIAHASPAGTPRAAAAFFFWVVNLNVSGITQGKPARLLINNRLAYEGAEVNRPLGITFAELDPVNKLLIFRDKTGATVTRSY